MAPDEPVIRLLPRHAGPLRGCRPDVPGSVWMGRDFDRSLRKSRPFEGRKRVRRVPRAGRGTGRDRPGRAAGRRRPTETPTSSTKSAASPASLRSYCLGSRRHWGGKDAGEGGRGRVLRRGAPCPWPPCVERVSGPRIGSRPAAGPSPPRPRPRSPMDNRSNCLWCRGGSSLLFFLYLFNTSTIWRWRYPQTM